MHRRAMTAAAYGSRIGARHARLSGTTKTISGSIFKQQIRVRLLAAWFARALLERSVPSIIEGAGNAGCALHPRSRVQVAQRNAHTSIQVQRRASGLPCAMALRLMPRSPRRRILVVTVACGLTILRIPVGRAKPPQT